MQKNNPIFSIVICTHNGEGCILNAIKSLLIQSFPKDDYEILVVDDGSTDNTNKILANLEDIKLITLKRNSGVSAARNAGIGAARGRIYVCFDDDCEADVDWLHELYNVYKSHIDVAGVGGKILSTQNPTLFEEFLEACGYGNPVNSNNYSYDFFTRLGNYLKFILVGVKLPKQTYKSNELHGGNSSFPIEVLKSVDGWSSNFDGIEDLEICKRISLNFKDKSFYIAPKAKLVHNHKLSFIAFLKSQIKRSKDRYKFYKKYQIMPPIFPFPILVLAIFGILLVLKLFWVIPFLLILPIFIYLSWPLKAISLKKLKYMTFPYFQLVYESTLLFGIIKQTILR